MRIADVSSASSPKPIKKGTKNVHDNRTVDEAWQDCKRIVTSDCSKDEAVKHIVETTGNKQMHAMSGCASNHDKVTLATMIYEELDSLDRRFPRATARAQSLSITPSSLRLTSRSTTSIEQLLSEWG
jgi:hypothetical protein